METIFKLAKIAEIQQNLRAKFRRFKFEIKVVKLPFKVGAIK